MSKETTSRRELLIKKRNIARKLELEIAKQACVAGIANDIFKQQYHGVLVGRDCFFRRNSSFT